ncbi:MAG TPA: aminotransferase class IV [Chitinophagales bacterium]
MIFWHNDSFISEEEKQFSVQERVLRYGDGFFESMIAVNYRVLWLSEHYERIVSSAEILKLEIEKSFSQEKFAEILRELLQKNDLKNARFRVVFYRKGEGLYAPQKNDAGVFITCSESPPINSLSVIETMAIYAENKKALGSLSNVKSCNALLYVMASLYAKEHNAQEAIILNAENNICEAITANVFIIQQHKIITPPLSSGCVAGVMRTKLLRELSTTSRASVIEERAISLAEISAADAVFLTNVSKGIQAVRTINDSVYSIEKVRDVYALYQKMLEREFV